MSRISDEHLAEIRDYCARVNPAYRSHLTALIAEVEYHRAQNAELYQLAESAFTVFESDTDEWVSQMHGLTCAVLKKCGKP